MNSTEHIEKLPRLQHNAAMNAQRPAKKTSHFLARGSTEETGKVSKSRGWPTAGFSRYKNGAS